MDTPVEAYLDPVWQQLPESVCGRMGWEQEVHTSDHPAQECGHRWQDPITWSRRAHELSEKEMFACLTRTDSGDESDSPCEPYCAPKPLDFDYLSLWCTETHRQRMAHIMWFTVCTPVSLAALLEYKYGAGLLGFRGHIFKQPDEPAAAKPMFLGPPDVPAPSEPIVPEIVHPVQCGITPKRPLLRHSDTDILSYIDEEISSIRNGYTAWVMSDPSTTLERHLARKGCAKSIFHEAYERNFSPAQIPLRQQCAKLLPEQTRISILSWNPGPRRGMPGATEVHIAGKWHIIALQEAVEYLQHEYLMNHFYITHFAGCAVQLNKKTFYSDVQVNSVYSTTPDPGSSKS